MKVAIIGSRKIKKCDIQLILQHLPSATQAIISGGASGVDSWAEEFARLCGFGFVEVRPDYEKYGKKAPLIRNRELVRQADCVLAIWDYRSRGTAHAIVCCIEEGVPVRILESDSLTAVDTSSGVY